MKVIYFSNVNFFNNVSISWRPVVDDLGNVAFKLSSSALVPAGNKYLGSTVVAIWKSPSGQCTS